MNTNKKENKMTTLQQQLKAQGLQTINTKTDELDQAIETIKDIISFVKINTGEEIDNQSVETMLDIQDKLHMALQGMHMEMDGEYCRYDEDEG